MRDLLVCAGHIGVVVARHDRDFIGVARFRKPFGNRLDLQGRGEIDEISGNRQVIRIAHLDVLHQAVERPGKEVAHPVPVPVDESGDPLGGEFAEGEIGQRPQVDIGYMRKFEH